MSDTVKLTPAQRQYVDLKKKYKDCILLFRMGDFYETFYEDAKICSKVLEIALTARHKTSPNPVPMAGVPHHSAEKYIARLVQAGYKVALAEQIGEVIPGKIVNRDVVKVVTPGTYMEEQDIKNYNFISGVFFDNKYHFAWGDFGIGEYWTKSFDSIEDLMKFILKISPRELIIDIDFPEKQDLQDYIKNFANIFISIYDIPADTNFFLKEILEVQTLSSFGKSLHNGRDNVLSLLFKYLKDTQKQAIKNISNISYWGDEDKVIFDDISIKNLEVFVSSYEGSKKHSLLGVIDNTKTPMGGRALHSLLLAPIQDMNELKSRYNNISYYQQDLNSISDIIKILGNIGDIPRIISKLIYKKNSPLIWQRFIAILSVFDNNIKEQLIRLGMDTNELQNIFNFYDKLNSAIKDDEIKEDIDYIKDGFDSEIDKLRKIAYHSDDLLLEYQGELIQKLGIQIKIKYISNQGYFIETSKKDCGKLEAQSSREDEKFDFIRRQTLKAAERYTSPYLDKVQGQILGAKEKLVKLEKSILENFKDELEILNKIFSTFANKIALLDIYTSMAILAYEKAWSMPELIKENSFEVSLGTHPVIQEYLPMGEEFIPNNLSMYDKSLVHIITGPNMGGKSTFLRQNALIVLLAHCGLPVPAKSAKIPLVDGIFARVGSGDLLAKNQSTFMTEMIEMSNILHNATNRSFVVIDELGRGTSTYDGMALAKAILIYIAKKLKAKTLFATHYHELIKIQEQVSGVENFSVSVYETDKEVVFLKKIVKGGADKSYGIDVAKLAGLPKEIIQESKSYLKELENGKSTKSVAPLFEMKKTEKNEDTEKLDEIKKLLSKIDLYNITPIQAMKILEELRGNLND